MYDPGRLKKKDIDHASEIKESGNKWDSISKNIDKDEKIEEIENKDYSQ